jgi:hypothetical protein
MVRFSIIGRGMLLPKIDQTIKIDNLGCRNVGPMHFEDIGRPLPSSPPSPPSTPLLCNGLWAHVFLSPHNAQAGFPKSTGWQWARTFVLRWLRSIRLKLPLAALIIQIVTGPTSRIRLLCLCFLNHHRGKVLFLHSRGFLLTQLSSRPNTVPESPAEASQRPIE